MDARARFLVHIPRDYRAIFLAGPTITLLADDDTVLATLTKIREHLAEGGSAMVPLSVPSLATAESIGNRKESRDVDGALLRVSTVEHSRNGATRTQRTVLRYEKHSGDVSIVEDRTWLRCKRRPSCLSPHSIRQLPRRPTSL